MVKGLSIGWDVLYWQSRFWIPWGVQEVQRIAHEDLLMLQ